MHFDALLPVALLKMKINNENDSFKYSLTTYKKETFIDFYLKYFFHFHWTEIV